MIAAVLLAVAGGLSGCTTHLTSTGLRPGPEGQSLAAENTLQDPKVVLDKLATRLHRYVDDLTQGLPIRTTTRFLDGRQACQIGATNDWPAQWIFDERVFLATLDARPAGRAMAERYAAQGWDVRTLPAAQDADRYSLRRDGYVISIAAASDDGSLSFQTSGPCVNADGTIAGAGS